MLKPSMSWVPWILLVAACSGSGGNAPDVVLADVADDVALDPADARDAAGDPAVDLPAPADAASDVSPDVPDVSPDVPDVSPPLYRVEGGRLLDRDGRTLILRGINVASGDLVSWGKDDPEVETKTFAKVARSGFNAVRLVINWDGVEPERDQWDEAYLDVVERHVRLAAAEGLLVFIDLHQDMYGIGFGNHGAPRWSCDEANYAAFQPIEPWFLNYFSGPVTACFDQFWKSRELRGHLAEAGRRVALRVADVEAVMGFDPINEPVPGTIPFEEFDTPYLLDFHAQFAGAVTPVLPGRVYFIEPAVTFSQSWQNDMSGPLPFPAVFAPHYYHPGVEAKLWDGVVGTLEEAVGHAADAAAAIGAPLVYGEMGGARETPNLGEYLVAFYRVLDARQAGAFQWIYSRGTTGFGMIDAETGDWNLHARAFLRPAPSRVAGVIQSFAWDDATQVFQLAWTADGQHATEVILPARIREAGFRLFVDGDLVGKPTLNATGDRIVVAGLAAGPRTLRLEVIAGGAGGTGG